MIRVCFSMDPPFLGGAEHYVARIISGLDRRRFEPSVIVRVPDDPDGRFEDFMGALGLADESVERVDVRLPFRPWTALNVTRALSRLRPHVLHMNVPGPYDAQMGLLAPLARMTGVRGVVTTEHLPMVGYLEKRAFVKRFAYRWVDRIVTVSRANAGYLDDPQGLPPGKVVVVPNAVADDYGRFRAERQNTREQLGIENNVPVVIFLGNLLPHKGLARVAEALVGVDADWHLLVVGEGEDRAACERILNRDGRSERVTFAGALTGDAVERALCAADVLCLPSTVEGMPYVILEAMACGLAVVASDVFGIPEMVIDGESGYLVGAEDIDALRRRLSEVLLDPALREKMGASGRRRFQEVFRLTEQVRTMERIYAELAGESN